MLGLKGNLKLYLLFLVTCLLSTLLVPFQGKAVHIISINDRSDASDICDGISGYTRIHTQGQEN